MARTAMIAANMKGMWGDDQPTIQDLPEVVETPDLLPSARRRASAVYPILYGR